MSSKSIIITHVCPLGAYLRELIQKNDTVNKGRNDEAGAGDDYVITMSPLPTSSTV